MRVFVAGATGAVGRPLLTQLIAAGDEVTATTRRPTKAEQLQALGATPVRSPNGCPTWPGPLAPSL